MAVSNQDIEEILTAAFFGSAEEMVARITPDMRLAHYTSAETALRIIRGYGTDQALWLRNATEMNDFSEIEYGQYCLEDTLRRPNIKDRINRINEALNVDISKQVIGPMDEERRGLKQDTFLLCLSEHAADDNMGALSMWRAYGGSANVCFVFHNHALTTPQEAYDVHITAVDYDGPNGFLVRFNRIIDDVEKNIERLQLIDQELLAFTWKEVLDDMVLSTKHPGFQEEKEWRIIFRRKANAHIPAPPLKTVVVGGIAQIVHYLPLVNVPEKGVSQASLEEILDKIIVGPTTNPQLVCEAFVVELAEAGLSNPARRVVTCEIPLRR
jgi:hypothetical protein